MKTIQQEMYEDLYVSIIEPANPVVGHVIFVHGGPGGHSILFEKMISEISAYENTQIGWICYDQRGCGRSKSCESVTHDQNISDLINLCNRVTEWYPEANPKAVFGHSYGARLAFDAFRTSPNLDLKLIISGRALYRNDPINLSTLIDLYVLREVDPMAYQKGYDIVKQHAEEPLLMAKAVRELFTDLSGRASKRSQYYWGNLEVMKTYQSIESSVQEVENDKILLSVMRSIIGSKWDEKKFDPQSIPQDCLVINGFWDFLMAGATSISQEFSTVFKGSGHYPHFEEADYFLQILNQFLAKGKVKR